MVLDLFPGPSACLYVCLVIITDECPKTIQNLSLVKNLYNAINRAML